MRYLVLFFFVLNALCADDQSYYPPSDAAGGWRTLKGDAEVRRVAGMDLSRLDAAFDYTKDTTQHGGLLVVRHGYLVLERYFGRGNRAAIPELA